MIRRSDSPQDESYAPRTDWCQYTLSFRTFCLHPRTLRWRSSGPVWWGRATALTLARRGVSVVVLEAETEPGLAASGTNSGILHTGFDSVPGELETELILRSAALRDPVLGALRVPVLRCGARLRPRDPSRDVVGALAANAQRNGVEVLFRKDGALKVPGEAVTDPVAYTLALARAAGRHGAELRTGFRVTAMRRDQGDLVLESAAGESVRSRLVVNCAGLHADTVARLAGDDSFEIYPRKGEFLVFDPPGGERLERILLPEPTERTKGVLVFPTVDGKVIAGPTAVDQPGQGRLVRAAAGPPGDPSAGRDDVAAPRGRRADRRLCRAATGGARRQLPDRALAGVLRARQRRGDPLHRTDRVARDRGIRLCAWWRGSA